MTRLTASLALGLLLAAGAPAAEVRGTVARADAARQELQLDLRGLGKRGQVMTFTVPRDTPILLGREPVSLGNLPPGKRVRVVYEIRGGKPTAQLVTGLNLSLEKLGGAVLPPPQPVPPAPAARPATAADGAPGELRRVALTDREIVLLGGKEGETTYQVPEGATILRDGKPIPFEGLQEGEAVLVQGTRVNDRWVARVIQAGTSTPAAAATPTPVPGQESRIQRLRGLLRRLDQLLEMADQRP